MAIDLKKEGLEDAGRDDEVDGTSPSPGHGGHVQKSVLNSHIDTKRKDDTLRTSPSFVTMHFSCFHTY